MFRYAALLLLLAAASAALADSWIPPSKQTYKSKDNAARLTVTPRDLVSPLAYFEDKVAGREPAGSPAGSRARSAMATLELRNGSGRWKTAWTGPLDNEVAPVDLVLANGGRAFATLDNWHSMGYGPNAIVIYGGEGKIIRRLGLADIFPEWFVAALPRSVSSIGWRGKPRISEADDTLIVPVVQPSNDEHGSGGERELDLAIRLSDGVPIGLQRPEWKAALVQAAATARESCKLQGATIREWNAPISAPETARDQDWHHYLRETQYRTKWADEPPAVATKVLRPASAANFEASLKWLEEALTKETVTGLLAVGSPDVANLTDEIERIAVNIRERQLKEVHVVIIAGPAHADRIRAALVRSGANLEIIDPARSIPQIKQRIQKETELAVCQAPEAS